VFSPRRRQPSLGLVLHQSWVHCFFPHALVAASRCPALRLGSLVSSRPPPFFLECRLVSFLPCNNPFTRDAHTRTPLRPTWTSFFRTFPLWPPVRWLLCEFVLCRPSFSFPCQSFLNFCQLDIIPTFLLLVDRRKSGPYLYALAVGLDVPFEETLDLSCLPPCSGPMSSSSLIEV